MWCGRRAYEYVLQAVTKRAGERGNPQHEKIYVFYGEGFCPIESQPESEIGGEGGRGHREEPDELYFPGPERTQSEVSSSGPERHERALSWKSRPCKNLARVEHAARRRDRALLSGQNRSKCTNHRKPKARAKRRAERLGTHRRPSRRQSNVMPACDHVKHIEAARMQLISPPPEEELQRTHVFGFPRTNTNTAMAQTKRKRASGVTIGSPSKTSAEPVEATPNPKPRKAHRRRTSTLESPSRPSFAHAHANPNADYVPPVTLTAPHGHGRRSASVTPYESPPDVFTPPREVLLAPPPSSTRKAAPKQKTKQKEKERTATPRARTQTPLRVVVHSVKKEPPPSIDRTRPMTPPNPTDDPLLLLPSSSPVKASHIRKRSVPVPVPTFVEEVEHEDEDGVRSSDAAYAPIDWTAGLPLDLDAPDAPTSDSMDLDMDPASFDGPLPVTLTLPLSVPLATAASADYDYDAAYDMNANAGWDSSDEDEGGDGDALPTTTTALGPTSSLNSLPGASPTPAGSRGTPTRTSTRIRSATPTTSLLPPFSKHAPVPTATISINTTLPTTPATTTPSLDANANDTNAGLTVNDFLHPTKPDPPTPRTRARAEAWGVWGSPWPGRTIMLMWHFLIQEPSSSSARLRRLERRRLVQHVLQRDCRGHDLACMQINKLTIINLNIRTSQHENECMLEQSALRSPLRDNTFSFPWCRPHSRI
ncbi:hypothetical protein C8R45DRAFT_1082696 [Mycena sanguinolenta]|nr:hypothetical protein C8R45DRAFT_1082696 [Mycena sanguinolenta]